MKQGLVGGSVFYWGSVLMVGPILFLFDPG